MELVEGEDLSQRIARGAVPLDEALPIARQIAEALEAAHEQGIIHRDLKPANIKVRADGVVKVLDFGLAKALEPDGPAVGDAAAANLANSPTITSPAMTMRGMILGTAAYMAPEQAKGKPVDKRADIWAFGCVLYEMLTGRRAFQGDDVSTTLAAVLLKEPDWQALPASTPVALRRLLTRCLKKDPKARLRDIGEARVRIDELLAGGADDVAAPVVTATPPAPRRLLPWVAAGALALAAILAAGAVALRLGRRGRSRPPVRFAIAPPENTSFGGPRGGRHRHRPSGGGVAGWPARRLRGPGAIRVSALAAAGRDPGRPADSGDRRRDVPVLVAGQPVHRVLRRRQAEEGPNRRRTGGRALRRPIRSWRNLESRQRHRVRARRESAHGTSSLLRVSGDGGVPTEATTLDPATGETHHRWPHFLPDGRHFLYTASTGTCCPPAQPAMVRVGSLDPAKPPSRCSRPSHRRYTPLATCCSPATRR